MSTHGLNTVISHLRRLVAPPPATGGDRELLARFVTSRDEAAFAALVGRYGPLVRGVARRVLGDAHAADDVFQATFLVLAKRAASIRKRTAVGSWLYGVAYRLAQQSRTRQARRERHERRAAIAPGARTSGSSDPVAWTELLAALDEELHRLPDHLRGPLLLCFYEGCTQDAAARRLGWSYGTLRRRLDRGLDLLRVRMTRRGATLGAGLFATALAPEMATAAVSPLLARKTVEAALTFAAGEAVAEPILQLAQEGLRMLGTSKLKIAVALTVVAGGLAGGIGAGVANWGPRIADSQDNPRAAIADPQAPGLPAGAVLRHGEANFRHGAEVINLLVTPDGKMLLTQGRRSIRVWDTATGRDTGSLELPDDSHNFWTGALTPDGRTLLTTRYDGTGQVWDLASRRLEARSFRLAAPPLDLIGAHCTHSPDGRLIAVVTRDGSLRVCDVTQGRELDHLRSHSDRVTAAGFTTDSKILILTCDDSDGPIGPGAGSVRFWDVATGKPVPGRSELRGVPPFAANLCLSPDGRWLAVATVRNGISNVEPMIARWDIGGGAGQEFSAAPLRYPSLASQLMRITPDSGYLFAPDETSGGRILVQWDLQTGRSIRQYPETSSPIRGVAFLSDGKTVVTADEAVHFWDWKSGQSVRNPPRRSQTGRGYALTPDGRTMAESDDAGTIHLWDATTGKEIRHFDPSRPAPDDSVWVHALAISPDGHWLAAQGGTHSEQDSDNSSRRYVWLWDLPAGRAGRRLNDLLPAPRAGPRGGGGRGNVELPAPRSERPSETTVNTLAFSPDSQTLASAGLGRTIVIWDMASGQDASVPGFSSSPAIAYTIDGEHLQVWNGSTQAHRTEISPEGLGKLQRNPFQQPITVQVNDGTVNYSADGTRMAILGRTNPGYVRVVDASHDQPVGVLRNLLRLVTRVAFAPDPRVIATASGEESPTITLWDVTTGQELKRFTGLHGQAAWLAFTQDGKRLFSASTDTTVLAWDVSNIHPPGP